MSTALLASGFLGAMLLFWMVGAYNRLVRLRGALGRRFQPVAEQLEQRQALLLQQLDMLTAALQCAAPRLDALRAACLQVESACEHARRQPAAEECIASLRIAEDILAAARARLPVQSLAGIDLGQINHRLAAADGALSFAARQYNEAAMAYNAAISMFPTVLLVGMFGFKSAGTL